MTSNLDIEITETHEVLRRRLSTAVAAHHVALAARDNVGATDDFLASTSRHLAAASQVLLPRVRRDLPDGTERAKAFVHQCRLLEMSLNQVKARLYGEVHAMQLSWQEVWSAVSHEFERTLDQERGLVDSLLQHDDTGLLDELAAKVYHAELRAPTRPHPFLPHRGLVGAVARRVAARVDRFYDLAEGRMVPEPVQHGHRKDSRIERYLLADPHVEDAPEEG